MTQPDQYVPSGAANYDSFAGFAGTSQEEWDALMRGGMLTAYGPLSGICFLLSQVPFIGGLISLGGGGGAGNGGPLGGMLSGLTIFTDLLCGAATGKPSTGTTPQTVLNGVTDGMNIALSDGFMSGIIGGGGIFGGLFGLQQLLGGICGLSTGNSGGANASPADMLATAQAMLNDAHHTLTGERPDDVVATDVIGVASLWVPQVTSGQIPAIRIPNIGTGSVAATQPNLLLEGQFRSAVAFAGQNGWVWDADGRTVAGSAKVVADGYSHEIVANEIPVVPGETVTVGAWVKWSGLTYTGVEPFTIGVTKYWRGEETGHVDFDSITTPAASGAWTELTGTHTIPAEEGIDEVRMRLKIAATATAGTVQFDDASATKPDLLSDPLVPGVGTIVDNLVNKLLGLTGQDWDHVTAGTALQNQVAATIANATAIQSLTSTAVAGTTASDEFERTDATGLGANWVQTFLGPGGGRMIVDGHDAVWDNQYSMSWHSEMCRWAGAGSDGDKQKITAVLGSMPAWEYGTRWVIWPFWSESWDYAAHNRLYARMSSDGSTYVMADFSGNGLVSLSYNIGAGDVLISSVQLDAAPGPGASIGLICGTARTFQVLVNGSVVLSASDSTSRYGPADRGWGWGVYAEADGWQAVPGKLNSWWAESIA